MKWFKSLSMKFKFGLLSTVSLLTITAISLNAMRTLEVGSHEITDDAIPLLVHSEKILQELLKAKENEALYLDTLDEKYLALFDQYSKSATRHMELIRANKIGANYEEKINALEDRVFKFEDDFHALAEVAKVLGKEDKGIVGEFRAATHKAEEIIKTLKNDKLYVQLLMMRRHEKDFLLRGKEKYVGKMEKRVSSFFPLVEQEVSDPAVKAKIKEFVNLYHGKFKELSTKWIEIKNGKNKLNENLALIEMEVQEVVKISEKEVDGRKKEFSEFITSTEYSLFFFSILLVVVATFFSSRIANTIIRKISIAVSHLNKLSSDTSNESNELKSQAGRLNSASVEQAAATQETSASMAEMESMITSTADEANSGYQNIQDISRISEESERSAKELKDSMNELTQSKDDLEKVLEVIRGVSERTEMINDIVFKTQLLSFNASIEAARAGQHGRGFSVVAEEIAQLANTSGSAAKEIEQLTSQGVAQVQSVVESVNARVDNGTQVSQQLMENFSQLRNNMVSTLESIESITNATNEQKTGIEQTNQAIAQLDATVTEFTSAANSVSSTADSLESFTKQIDEQVKNIHATISGSGKEDSFDEPPSEGAGVSALSFIQKAKSKVAATPAVDAWDDDEITADDFDNVG